MRNSEAAIWNELEGISSAFSNIEVIVGRRTLLNASVYCGEISKEESE